MRCAMRLDKYLADCGAGSRSEIKKMIHKGFVTVDGVPCPKPETQLNPETAVVTLHGITLQYKKYIYLLLNKPQGYVSATWDKKLPTVLDLVPEEYLHFEPFPVGRLDIDTEGLCLLTNDGALAHRLLSPKSHIPKTYEATVEGVVTEKDTDAFRQGVTLDDGYLTKPAELEILKSDTISQIRLTIYEGKFHQVKRMFEAVGKKVIFLKRIAMHRLWLDESLESGELRELLPEELHLLEWEDTPV
ncbi:MAG: rRNA pseudouridine synthase [Clostridia bacterium]|nr:rRNA pseudouridine synthase [Clostridia bacterium]